MRSAECMPVHTDNISINRFRISQLQMCEAIAAELNRQCPGITKQKALMGDIIEAADSICKKVNHQGGHHEKAPE